MKLLKIFSIVIIILVGAFVCKYYYYDTLMLSDVVGKSQNNLVNISINLFDFDTGLTRRDIHHLQSSKDYWIKRISEVESINNAELKEQEYQKLVNEMLNDSSMKKISKGLLNKGTEITKSLLEAM